MNDPLIALIVGIIVVLIAAAVVWPQVGILTRWKKAKRDSVRILIEDALKHLYDCEYRHIDCTLESIAGALSVSNEHVSKLVQRLEAMELVVHDGIVLKLTPEGRSYALRVIRVHRLWERYLSDETNIGESKWHARAERQEHRLTPQEAEQLSHQLGNPLYDPHGDPIPTGSGQLPEWRGVPLTSLKVGESAGIVHIEDEPAAIYAQLVALGLFPGMRVHLLDHTAERFVLESQGNEIALAPVVAANITVVPMAGDQQRGERQQTLTSLQTGEVAVVSGISSACRGLQRRRLMDLGVVPGTRIEVEMTSATGDPRAYRIRGATIALRKELTDLIFIRSEQGASA